jgi:F-type H+-transporting ATPase subunit a
VAKKRGCLGCSMPLAIGIAVVFIGLLVFGFVIGPIGQGMFGFEPPAWIDKYFVVHAPAPHLPTQTVFHIGPWAVQNTIIATWITMIVLIGLSLAVKRRSKLVPGRLQGMFEALLMYLYDFCVSVAGEVNGRRFFPLVATIFLFVLANAWLGLIPGFGTIIMEGGHGHIEVIRAANTDINTALALACVSFVAIWFVGFRFHGFKYLGKFFPLHKFGAALKTLFTGHLKKGLGEFFGAFIEGFIGLLEFLSEFIRVISFTFRLFGNMTAGEILLLVMAFLVPYVVSVIFYGLELLVGAIQALIFGGLTLIFMTTAAAAHGEEEH